MNRNSVKMLLVAVIATTALVRGAWGPWLVVAEVAAWGVYTMVIYFKSHPVAMVRFTKPKRIQAAPEPEAVSEQAEPEPKIVPTPVPPAAPQMATAELLVQAGADELPIQAALRQMNCRVRDKLQSVYPDATWAWVTDAPEQLALQGGCGRIRLSDAGEYNYADVNFDTLGNIGFKLMKIVDLAQAASAEEDSIPKKKGGGPAPKGECDVSAWYGLIGQSKIEQVVTDVNSRGHRCIFIQEGGDVFVTENGAPMKQATLEQMPAPKFWNQLIDVMGDEDGLTVSVENGQLRLSWANN